MLPLHHTPELVPTRGAAPRSPVPQTGVLAAELSRVVARASDDTARVDCTSAYSDQPRPQLPQGKTGGMTCTRRTLNVAPTRNVTCPALFPIARVVRQRVAGPGRIPTRRSSSQRVAGPGRPQMRRPLSQRVAGPGRPPTRRPLSQRVPGPDRTPTRRPSSQAQCRAMCRRGLRCHQRPLSHIGTGLRLVCGIERRSTSSPTLCAKQHTSPMLAQLSRLRGVPGTSAISRGISAISPSKSPLCDSPKENPTRHPEWPSVRVSIPVRRFERAAS